MPHFRGDLLDNAVWEWVKAVMQNPTNLAAGLRERQAEKEQANEALTERLALVESQLPHKQGS